MYLQMVLLTFRRQGIKSKCEGEIVIKKKTSLWHLLIYPPKDNVVSVYIITTLPNQIILSLIVQGGLHPFLGFRFFLTSQMLSLDSKCWIRFLQNECFRDTCVFFIANYNLKYGKVITNRKTSPLACSCKAVCRELPMAPMAKSYNDVSLYI